MADLSFFYNFVIVKRRCICFSCYPFLFYIFLL